MRHDVTELNEHGLAALGAKLREAVKPLQDAGVPDYLTKTLGEAADLMDAVVAGTGPAADVQGAIDRINAAFERHNHERLQDAATKLEAAAGKDDPDAWRESLADLIAALPDDAVYGLMQIVDVALAALSGAVDLADMEVAGSC